MFRDGEWQQPEKDNGFIALIIIITLVSFSMLIGLAIYGNDTHPREREHIEVNGQDCLIEEQLTSISSHGMPSYKKIAHCPKKETQK